MHRGWLVSFVIFAFLAACGDDGDQKPTLASVHVQVVEEGSGDAIGGARVLLVDADTGAPAGPSLVTDADGRASARVEPGALYLRVDAAGHHPRPLPGGPAVPVEFAAGSNPERVVELIPRDGAAGRTLAGVVREGQGVLGAVLVVAEGPVVRTTFTDAEGEFVLFDLPAGAYTVRALLAGHAGEAVAATVPTDADPAAIELRLDRGGTGSVEGQVSFLAVQNGAVRVTLQDRASGEAVPGLSAPVTDGTYRVDGVPPGTYIAWAALENELPVGYVMDPDAILKFGLPIVTVAAGASVTQDFDVTGAVQILSPAPAADALAGPVVVSATPTFEWAPYSSADRYFLEVADELGRIAWGGFDGETPRVEVPKETVRIAYGAVDGTNPLALVPGRVYRFRVWAAKADNQDPRGFRIISATEEQRGLFEVGK
jgi:hypothetical protein